MTSIDSKIVDMARLGGTIAFREWDGVLTMMIHIPPGPAMPVGYIGEVKLNHDHDEVILSRIEQLLAEVMRARDAFIGIDGSTHIVAPLKPEGP